MVQKQMYEQGWRVMVKQLITLKLLFDLKIFPRAMCILFCCALSALIFPTPFSKSIS